MTDAENHRHADESPEYYKEYKRIRNKLNEYDGISIVIEIAQYLRLPTKNMIEEGMKHPWLCMLLIKWAALEREFCIKNMRSITYNELHNLLGRLLNMSPNLRPLKGYDHYSLFLRNFAFQQFWYQRNPYVYSIARQSLLFCGLDRDNTLRQEYLSRYGIDVEDAIYLSLPLHIFLCQDNRPIFKPEHYGDMIPKYRDKIDPFLALLSRDRNALHDYLVNNDRVKRTSWEYYEETPLVRYPLFKFEEFYVSYSRQVTARALESHFYDVLKEVDPNWFMTEFGEIFERYIEMGLKYTNLPYLSEDDIRAIIGAKKKVVDFMVPLRGSTLLIDAKAVELSYSAKLSHLRHVVENATRQSVFKAIEQAYSVISQFETKNEEDTRFAKSGEYFLFVVTYKELFLSGGSYFYEQIAKEEIDAIREKYQNTSMLPLNNIFFLTIEEYEILTAMVRNGVDLNDLLRKAASAQSKLETRKYQFHDHYQNYMGKLGVPKFLVDELERILNQLGVVLENGSKMSV